MLNLELLNRKGYTYIELLGVIAIIVLVVTPILFMMDNILDKSLKSHRLNEANSVCISVMDRARFDVKHVGEGAVRSGSIGEDEFTYYNIPDDYQVELNIAQVEDFYNLFAIDISLSLDSISLSIKSLVYYE